MADKRNQYYWNTDQRIQNAMLELIQTKKIDKITVSELCDLAEINRSSFYAHYIDIKDLMDKMEEENEKGILAIYHNTDISLENFLSEKRVEYLSILIRFIGEHRDFYRAYLGSFLSDVMERDNNALYHGAFVPYLRRMGYKSDKDIKYYYLFLKNGLMSVVKNWLDTGCEESPEEIAALIWNSVPGVVQK